MKAISKIHLARKTCEDNVSDTSVTTKPRDKDVIIDIASAVHN